MKANFLIDAVCDMPNNLFFIMIHQLKSYFALYHCFTVKLNFNRNLFTYTIQNFFRETMRNILLLYCVFLKYAFYVNIYDYKVSLNSDFQREIFTY